MWIRLGDFVCFVCLALAFLLPLGRSILMLLFGVLVPCLHFFSLSLLLEHKGMFCYEWK